MLQSLQRAGDHLVGRWIDGFPPPGDLRPSALLDELDRIEGFQRRPAPSVLDDGIGEDQTGRPLDVADHAPHGERPSIAVPHIDPDLSSGLRLHHHLSGGEASGPPPCPQLQGIGPGLEDGLPRTVHQLGQLPLSLHIGQEPLVHVCHLQTTPPIVGQGYSAVEAAICFTI